MTTLDLNDLPFVATVYARHDGFIEVEYKGNDSLDGIFKDLMDQGLVKSWNHNKYLSTALVTTGGQNKDFLLLLSEKIAIAISEHCQTVKRCRVTYSSSVIEVDSFLDPLPEPKPEEKYPL